MNALKKNKLKSNIEQIVQNSKKWYCENNFNNENDCLCSEINANEFCDQIVISCKLF